MSDTLEELREELSNAEDARSLHGVAKDAIRLLSAATARASELERERDEARDWVRRLTAESRVLTCVYCGHAYPPGSPEHGAEVLTEHIKVCEKHPMRAMGERVARAELQLKSLDLLCAFASETEAHVSLYVLDGGLRRVEVGSIWTNGDSAGAAALILAAGHGLLQPEKEGTTDAP